MSHGRLRCKPGPGQLAEPAVLRDLPGLERRGNPRGYLAKPLRLRAVWLGYQERPSLLRQMREPRFERELGELLHAGRPDRPDSLTTGKILTWLWQ